MSLIKPYTFVDPTNYNYNTAKVDLSGNCARLKLIDLVGQLFNQPFTSDAGFTYDSSYVEFVAGTCRQKDKTSGALFGANFTVDQDANWATGSVAGILYGGASVTGGKLDLSGGAKSYAKYNPTNNLGISQGAIKFKVTPKYSGSPPAYYWFFCDVNLAGIANEFSFFQTNSGNLCISARDRTGVLVINTVSFGNWGQTADQTYEFELNYNIAPGGSEIRLFIDGVQKGATITTAYTRDDHGRLFFGCEWSESTNADFLIDDILLFDTVQHTANYTPGYTVYTYKYQETKVELPQFAYSGSGAIQGFVNVSSVFAGAPHVVMNGLYYNSGWIASNGTYTQSNTLAELLANITTFPASDTLDIDVIFPDSNTISSMDNLTIMYTGQISPTDNPKIVFLDTIRIEELLDFILTATITGNDSVTFLLGKNGVPYYHNGSAWVVSNGLYTQSNTAAEILLNISTFTTESVSLQLSMFLHSDDGSTTPVVCSVSVEYDFVAEPGETLKTIVYGRTEIANGIYNTDPFIIRLAHDVNEYNSAVQIRNTDIYVEPRSTGYWEVELTDTETMESGSFYYFIFPRNRNMQNARIEKRTVPQQDSIAYNSLPEFD